MTKPQYVYHDCYDPSDAGYVYKLWADHFDPMDEWQRILRCGFAWDEVICQ